MPKLLEFDRGVPRAEGGQLRDHVAETHRAGVLKQRLGDDGNGGWLFEIGARYARAGDDEFVDLESLLLLAVDIASESAAAATPAAKVAAADRPRNTLPRSRTR